MWAPISCPCVKGGFRCTRQGYSAAALWPKKVFVRPCRPMPKEYYRSPCFDPPIVNIV